MKRKSKLPHVFICQDAANKTYHEVERFYQKGLTLSKHPWEAAMYPLAYLQLKPGTHKSPLELVNLTEIDFVVIAYVFYPIDRYKDYGPGHARFKPGASEYLNPIIDDFIKKYPLLDAFCKMHSHPGGGHYISPGDLYHNILNSYHWMRNKGLNTMFSFVLTPLEIGWQFNCYGLNNYAINVKLPHNFVPRNHSLVKRAKELPYYLTEAGSAWCNRNKAELKKTGYQISRNILRRGWRRYTIRSQQNVMVICLPPDFPTKPIKAFWVTSNPQNQFQEILTPDNSVWSQPQDDLAKYHLIDLVTLLEKQLQGEN